MKRFIFQNHMPIVKNKTKTELDLPSYATKFNLKGLADINTSEFA